MKAKITSKGQLTVPKKVREYLNLKIGDEIKFSVNETGEVVISSKKVSFRSLKNILPKKDIKVSVEEMNKAIAKSAAE